MFLIYYELSLFCVNLPLPILGDINYAKDYYWHSLLVGYIIYVIILKGKKISAFGRKISKPFVPSVRVSAFEVVENGMNHGVEWFILKTY